MFVLVYLILVCFECLFVNILLKKLCPNKVRFFS